MSQLSWQGVTKEKGRRTNPYRARLSHHKGRLDLGRFATHEEAALAYDYAIRRLGLAKKAQNHPSYSLQHYYNPSVENKVLNFAQQHPGLQVHSTTPPAWTGHHNGSAGALSMGSVGVWQPLEHVSAIGKILPEQQLQHAAGTGMLAPTAAAEDLSMLPLQQLAFGTSLNNTSSALLSQHVLAVDMLPPVNGQLWPPLAQPVAEGLPRQQQPAPDEDNSEMMAIMADILAEEDSEVSADVGACPDAAMESLTQLLLLQKQPLQKQQSHPGVVGASVSGAATPAGSDVSGSIETVAENPGQLLAAASSSDSSQLIPAAAAALGNAQPRQQQQHGDRLALSCCREVVLFIDVFTTHLLQLYTELTAHNQQVTGLLAVQWVSGVRMSLYAPRAASSSSGSPPPPPSVRAAVMLTSASLVSLAASGTAALQAAGTERVSWSWDHLVLVVEGLMKELMTLRGLYSGCPAGEGLGSSVLQAFQGQLQAQASTDVGQAVAALLSVVLDRVQIAAHC